MLIYHYTHLSPLIGNHPELIAVVDRFGIKPGYADCTIAECADANNSNLFTLLEVLNIYYSSEYYPSKIDASVTISSVAEFIEKTNRYLLHSQLYNISKHLSSLLTVDKMRRVAMLFEDLKREFELEISRQTEHEYPALNSLEQEYNLLTTAPYLLIEPTASCGDTKLEEMVADIKKAMIMHMGGEININMFHAVVFSLSNLEHELKKLRCVKERLLYPLVESTKSVISHQSSSSAHDNKPSLSSRELEVLQLIASGYLNKEIANSLDISINTVLTHRKNITSKLGIKSVSGLTFYALTNGVISSDEIIDNQ